MAIIGLNRLQFLSITNQTPSIYSKIKKLIPISNHFHHIYQSPPIYSQLNAISKISKQKRSPPNTTLQISKNLIPPTPYPVSKYIAFFNHHTPVLTLHSPPTTTFIINYNPTKIISNNHIFKYQHITY